MNKDPQIKIIEELHQIHNEIDSIVTRLEHLPTEARLFQPCRGALHSLSLSMQSINNLQVALSRLKLRKFHNG